MGHAAVTDNAHLDVIVCWSITYGHFLIGMRIREVLLAEPTTVAGRQITTEETWRGTSTIVLDMRVGLKHGDESSPCQPISKIDIGPVQREKIGIPTANLIPRGQPGERTTRYDPVESLIAIEVLGS